MKYNADMKCGHLILPTKIYPMRYKMVAIFYFLFACTTCHAQTISGTKNNAVSLEIGKSGLIYNLNFDHRFPGKDFGFRFGVGSNFAKYLQAFTGGAGGYGPCDR